MNFDFDFFNMYDNLGMLNEHVVLTEGDYGKYKKAFLNFINGLYYDANNKISDATLAPRTTKISTAKAASELAGDANVNTTETNFETGSQQERSPRDIVRAVNRSIPKNQVALYSKKRVNPETGEKENLYTVYNKYPSILHHMNADHSDNAIVKGYTYTDPNNGEKTRTSVFFADDPKLYNYVLITANQQSQAKYGHMMIHLLAMIIASVGSMDTDLLDKIIGALDAALTNNNNGSTIFTIYVNDASKNYIEEFYTLSGLYNAIKDNPNWLAIIDTYKPKTSLQQAVGDDDKE
jgi:hypothetical protein